MKTATIKLTSAIGVRGEMFRAGSIIDVPEAEAKSLLHRGKAVLATEADDEQPEEDSGKPAKASKK